MTDDMSAEARIADARRRIAAQGWMIQGVADIHDDTGAQDMMFTVGLTEAGLPELVIFGIPRDRQMQSVAERVLQYMARFSLGEELVAGRSYSSGLGIGDEVMVCEGELGKPLGLAFMMYGRANVRYLIIDPAGTDSV